jgi:Domain of unknown function (DUF4276)
VARLLIHVEGETEETFVNEVLRPHLYSYGYESVGARLLGNARQRIGRGGIKAWNAVRSDIVQHLKEDTAALATTMVDYYGMPETGSRAWPGREQAGTAQFPQKAATVENAMLTDVIYAMGANFNSGRFIPFVVMHEFEGLLFSDCVRFAYGIGQPGLATTLQNIRNRFNNPEEINDSPLTHPSKRVQDLVPGYEKPLLGTLAAIEVGLDSIRVECPNFRRWIERLEASLV